MISQVETSYDNGQEKWKFQKSIILNQYVSVVTPQYRLKTRNILSIKAL